MEEGKESGESGRRRRREGGSGVSRSRGRVRWHSWLWKWQHIAHFSGESKMVTVTACNLRLTTSKQCFPCPCSLPCPCWLVPLPPWRCAAPGRTASTPAVELGTRAVLDAHPAGQPCRCHAMPCRAASEQALLWRIVRQGSRQSWGREESILKRTCQVQLALSV